MLCLSGPSANLDLEDDKGLNLFDAPDMGEGLFIGREAEFQDMESILQPQSDPPGSTRKVLILGQSYSFKTVSVVAGVDSAFVTICSGLYIALETCMQNKARMSFDGYPFRLPLSKLPQLSPIRANKDPQVAWAALARRSWQSLTPNDIAIPTPLSFG